MDDYLKKILSKNLADLRKSHGLKGMQVADILGISASAYSRWENGLDWIGSDSLPKIERLASFYRVLPSRFFYDPTLDQAEAAETWLPSQNKEAIKKLEEAIALLK